MAQKKQPQKHRLRTLLLLLLIPFIVWFVAFLLWFYWYDVSGFFDKDDADRVRPEAARQGDKIERRERTPSQPPEKIFEEDRRQLEELLKRRN